MTQSIRARHAGTRALLQHLESETRTHLEPDRLRPGDVVIGTLPLALAAAVEARGAAFWSFTFDQRPEDRGQDLPAATLQTRNPRLERYRLERVGVVGISFTVSGATGSRS